MKKLNLLFLFSLLFYTSGTFAQNNSEVKRRPRPQMDAERPVMHDPVAIKEGDTYYIFSTGNGIDMFSSKDMKKWKFEGAVFDTIPQWAMDLIPEYKGHTWAPDIIFHDGLYHIYYSCSAFAKNTSAIGHATTPTLDRSSKNYKWTDHGMIIQSVPYRDMWNAIDPNIIFDENGEPWMNFGSFWDGIKMVKLTPDLSAVAQPEEWLSLSRRDRTFTLNDKNPGDGAVEAPFIMKHGDYYYLFVSFDYCCRGNNSDYKLAVGRSESAKGPYLDKEGNDMAFGGGTVFLEGNDEWAGVGHNSAYNFDGKDYMFFHGYYKPHNGAPLLLVREIEWDEEGWPVVNL